MYNSNYHFKEYLKAEVINDNNRNNIREFLISPIGLTILGSLAGVGIIVIMVKKKKKN